MRRDDAGALVAGDTCPFRLRLTRYVTDIGPPRPMRHCPIVDTSSVFVGGNAMPCVEPP